MTANFLASNALLVDVSISQWTARKVDKAQSTKLTEENKANAKAAHVSKKLMVNPLLTEIARLVTDTREFHKRLTLPWLENGARILPAKLHKPYFEGLDAREERFIPLVDRFCEPATYERFVREQAEQHVALGLLFEPSDYPKASRIRAKFAWRVTPSAVPNADDFRVDIGQAALDRHKAEITATVNTVMTDAVRSVIERCYEVASDMVGRLSKFDPNAHGKERGAFRDSVIDNVRLLVDVLPGLNIMNDPGLTMLTERMRELIEHDGVELRESDNLRAKVIQRANDIVQAVSDLMA